MKRLSLAIITLLACAGAQATSEEKVTMNLVTSQGVGQAIGTVSITETGKGLEFTPDLKALPPSEHGFHVHANGSCQPAIKDGRRQRRNQREDITTLTKRVNTKAGRCRPHG